MGNPLCSCKRKRKCELEMVTRNVGFAPRFLEQDSPCGSFAHWVFPQIIEALENGEQPDVSDGRWGRPAHYIGDTGQLVLRLAKELGYDVSLIMARHEARMGEYGPYLHRGDESLPPSIPDVQQVRML